MVTGRSSGEIIRKPSLREMILRSLLPLMVCAQSASALKPNIVIIYADDLGFGDVSCQGATAVITPQIDALAAGGLRFTDAHSSAPTCTPSRYSLMTGEYAWRSPGTGIAAGDAGLIIRPGSVTLPSMLRQSGYSTGAVGKWHLGLGVGTTNFNGEIKPGPLDVGFDYFFGLPATSDRVPCVYLENRHVFQSRLPGDPGYVANAGPIVVSYAGKVGNDPTQGEIGTSIAALNASPMLRPLAPYTAGERTTHQGDAQHSNTIVNGIARIGYMDGGENARWDDDTMAFKLVSKASDYIATQTAANKPFFLYYAAHDIHVPHAPNVMFQGTSNHGIRGDAIRQFDWQVGQIIQRLSDPNQDGNPADSVIENTLVVLTSDNGPVLGDGYYDGAAMNPGNHDINGPYKGGKYSVSEGGHRVPFIVRWPGRIPAGQVSNALVAQTDLLASFAALTGQPLPLDAGPDSENVLPALLGDSPQGRQYLVNQNGSNAKAIRSGGYKYFFDDALFYNLDTDPGEVTNTLAANTVLAGRMKQVKDDIAAIPMQTPFSGWWPMDETQGAVVRDLSGGGHPGTLSGAPARMTEGGKPFVRFAVGQAFSAPAFPAVGADFSVALWARSPSATWGSTSCLIARRPQFALETVSASRKIAFVVNSPTGVPQRLELDLSSISGFELTAWHHYAVTYDGSTGTATISIDGVKRAQAVFATGTPAAGNGALEMAADLAGSSSLACDLSDVRIHSVVLTPARVVNAAAGRLLDQDADGMLDDWEMIHRLALFDASDATADPDNDAVNNLAEFRAGTDPSASNVDAAGGWKFDDGTGTVAADSSGNSRPGNLVNGPSWVTEGGRRFLSFDGVNDYVEVPAFPDLTSDVTVACWARSDAANWNAAGCLVSRRGQWILHPWLNPAGSNRLSFLIVRADTGAEVQAQIDLATLPGFDIRQWHHYAGTYEKATGTSRLYVDGVLRATNTIPAVSLKATTSAFRIGSDTHPSARFFGGDIDEVRVHGRPFSAAEIAALAGGFDDDDDGMPDDFERRIAGASATDSLVTPADVLPGDDFDHDGRTNLEESAAGTDPISSLDFFRLHDFFVHEAEATSSFNVKVEAKPGRVYELEQSLNLSPPWTPVQALGPFTDTQLIELIQPELPGPKGFYRVRVKPGSN